MRWVVLFSLLWGSCLSQTITTKAKIMTVLEKTSFEIPCIVKDMNEDVSVAWHRADDLLFLDEERMTDDNRYTITKEDTGTTHNYVLSVNNAEPFDSADFICSTTTHPILKVTHKVIVNSPPLVGLNPEMPIYHVKVGDTNVVVKCYVRGNPTPKISWERQDDNVPEGVVVRGSSLVIKKASREHSGTYSCVANNEAGKDSRAIEIRVNDANMTDEKPWVKAAYGDGFIAAKKGSDSEIVCTFNGSPEPQLEWFFNGYKINFQEERFRQAGQTFQREKGYTKATLLLAQINEDMFGDYQCRASNQFGSEQVAVHVSGRPGPPKLELDQSLLSWNVRSFEDIIEYRVHLRLQKQDEWSRHVDIRVHKNDKKGQDLWSREVDLREYVEPGVKYEVQVKARNGLGWGSFAKDYITIEVRREQRIRSTSGVMCLLPSLLGFIFFYLF